MKPLAKNTSAMPGSGIRLIMHKSMEIPDAIHLEAGQPNFNTPRHIIEAAYKSALDGYTGYTPSAGLPSLREAIADKVTNLNGIKATRNNVVVTVGGVGGITTTLFALVDAGDEVMVPDPGWPNYSMSIALCGAKKVSYLCYEANGFVPDLTDIENRITNKTKVIIVNTPSNPSGAVYPVGILKGIVEVAKKHDLYVISDEAYEELVFEGEHVSPAKFDTDGRVVSVFTFSKSYAMTGWRVGYVIASEQIVELLTKIQEPYNSCAPSISQKAAEAALTGPQDCVTEMANAYRHRRDLALEILQPKGFINYKPQGAFYMLLDITRAKMDSFEFALELLEKKHVGVAPGATFGELAKNHVRICVATDDESLVEGVKRFCEFVLER